MEKFSIKTLFMMGLVAASLLSSCSRQIASTASVNKMLNNEQLTSIQKPLASKTAACLPTDAIDNTCRAMSMTTPSLPIKSSLSGIKFKDGSKKFAKSFPSAVVRKIQSQTAFVRDIAKNHDIASYSGSQHTEGMLGIAGLCLIAAIALAVFGVTNMGVVFWEIAAVLFIAAIVFFVLYLVAKAAGPSTP
jgi:hypothetical protein